MRGLDLIAEVSARFQIFWNADYGSVMVEIDGQLSPDEIARFNAAIAGAIARSRARHGHALLLFDTSGNALLGDAVVAAFQTGERQTARDGDRIALVVSSSLMKLRMRGIPADDIHPEYFISRAAAEPGCTRMSA